MTVSHPISLAKIEAARSENPKLRARDLAEHLEITEGQLVAAAVGQGVVRISAEPNTVMPELVHLGEVMALTRNESCVMEKVGIYDDYRPGDHASMFFNLPIDLRFFPKHFVHGFAVETKTDKGTKRSLQFFDAAGDAVHKIHLREASDLDGWAKVVETLKVDDQTPGLDAAERAPVEGAKGPIEKAEKLRAEWDKMTDTHQFLMMVRKMKMNRLGAYRIAGAPYVEKLDANCIPQLLNKAVDNETPIMMFVGNQGCIEIHTGPIKRVVEMGPWINILDPGFDMHLRMDHIAEVWLVNKNTRAGTATSVEVFDAEGYLIAQFFGVLREEGGAEAWKLLTDSLPREQVEEVA